MSKKPKAVWREMTEEERAMACMLKPGRVKYAPGLPTKNMAASLAAQAEGETRLITDRQAAAMWRIAWTFRRQIPQSMMGLVIRKKSEERPDAK